MRIKVEITPGSMGLGAILLKLLGPENVDVGEWLSPCWCYIDQDEFLTLKELILERLPEAKFKWRPENSPTHVWNEDFSEVVAKR